MVKTVNIVFLYAKYKLPITNNQIKSIVKLWNNLLAPTG
jgi:hypothetical protein